MEKFFLFFVASVFLFFCNAVSGNEANVFEYQNPIEVPCAPDGIRDPQIVRHNGLYYMTGTIPGFWPGSVSPGVKLFSSPDLRNWKDEGFLIDRKTIPEAAWYRDRFWAPELHAWQGKWYLSFNARNESKEHPHFHGCALAVADDIKGPYRMLTLDKPLVRGNDLHIFVDDDNRTYAFWNGGYIFACEIDLEKGTLTGIPKKLFTKSPEKTAWDYIGIEGSYVWKHNKRYYLFYSSWSRGYEVGYATADSVFGPWTKNPGNPIYGNVNPRVLRRFRLPLPADYRKSPFLNCGHNAIFTGPDGNVWISAHGIRKDGTPRLCFDPLKIDVSGTIQYSGPTFEKQIVSFETTDRS